MVSKVIIKAGPPEEVGNIGTASLDPPLVDKILNVRAWCYDNLKNGWRTYELTAGGGTTKYFVVFEFDSRKDEMLFRLYTGT